MDLPVKHYFECVKCGLLQGHPCDRPDVPAEEIHYYHHQEDHKEPHSVEISKNAKGEYSYSIKAYGSTLEEARLLVRGQALPMEDMLAMLKGGDKE